MLAEQYDVAPAPRRQAADHFPQGAADIGLRAEVLRRAVEQPAQAGLEARDGLQPQGPGLRVTLFPGCQEMLAQTGLGAQRHAPHRVVQQVDVGAGGKAILVHGDLRTVVQAGVAADGCRTPRKRCRSA